MQPGMASLIFAGLVQADLIEIGADFVPFVARGREGDIAVGADKPDAILAERRARLRLEQIAMPSDQRCASRIGVCEQGEARRVARIYWMIHARYGCALRQQDPNECVDRPA